MVKNGDEIYSAPTASKSYGIGKGKKKIKLYQKKTNKCNIIFGIIIYIFILCI